MSEKIEIRNISYKELIHCFFIFICHTHTLLEIYPIRNWYSELTVLNPFEMYY